MRRNYRVHSRGWDFLNGLNIQMEVRGLKRAQLDMHIHAIHMYLCTYANIHNRILLRNKNINKINMK